jgi:CRP/FNR family transcriptional regulator, cyclic AMP receptor protein
MTQTNHPLEMIDFLQRVPVLSALNDAEQRQLLDESKLLHIEQDTLIQASGTPHHHLYLVISGQISMCGSTAEGEELTLAVFGPRSLSSWMALFHDSPAERGLVAQAGSRLIAFPAESIKAMLARNPDMYPRVLKLEAVRFRAALNLHQLTLLKNRTQRLAGLMLMLVNISGDQRAQPEILLKSEQLARLAQCSRQVLFLAIKELAETGAVTQGYGKVIIKDIDRLHAIYEPDIAAKH